MMKVKVAIAGVAGKMGQSIARELSDDSGYELVGALEHPDSPFIGKSLGDIAGTPSITVPIQGEEIINPFDVMVDFTRPEGLKSHLDLCISSGSGILVGTTGLGSIHRALIDNASTKIPVLYAANTSIGVNLCAVLVEMASRALGKIFDIEVIEAHHRDKVDAPSGTALYLGEAASRGSGLSFPDCGVFAREGITGKRVLGTIGFSTIRGGDIAGEHTVLFIGEKERIEITHRATDRVIFAKGAIRAAKWLSGRKPGLYTMKDVLEIDGVVQK
ncbi:MAG: 4-hydroxy-tetrahydrodipicolinate reductase [Gammaproteobacteria bacterium]|nr:4-hydroxy-tetrahydrodipicolinate reductase [Gammaproteobacteria bacterium]